MSRMKRVLACTVVVAGEAEKDQWPAMRDALIAWKPSQTWEQPGPPPKSPYEVGN